VGHEKHPALHPSFPGVHLCVMCISRNEGDDPTDHPNPSILYAEGWEQPISHSGPVNTAGGKDAPFLLFFKIPEEKPNP